MRVLVVEDDAKIAAFVAKGLKRAGFAVDQAVDGEAGLHLALMAFYDVLVIDIMLTKLDGLTLINRLRQERIDAPVIILSAKRSVDDRVNTAASAQ
jgi:two-component system, OmpR family, response regulator